jgi:hypothetical protein
VRTKLYRNLKPGDRIMVRDATGEKSRAALVTVLRVQECRAGYITGKRRWEVIADYPWWWHSPITAYSDDRTEVHS